jgi:cation transport protein ChaC
LKVAAGDRNAVLVYLRERELVTNVYLERFRTIRFMDGGTQTALVYVVDRGHRQYAGRLPVASTVEIVRASVGRSGRNIDYVRQTMAHLREVGIRDPHLEAIVSELDA